MTANNGIRINKYIADAGICSRRAADRLIQEGRVSVDGSLAENGTRVQPGMEITVDGNRISGEAKKVYLAFHKPKGIVCTSEKREKNNIIDYLHYPVRITYCGRLDKDSEGLIIMTNDGDIINGMMRGRNCHEKEYLVTVDRRITEEFLDKLRKGVYLEELNATTRSCRVEALSDREFRIILTQGLNRQIRRMCACLGYCVERLIRVRVMNIVLDKLPHGKYRELTEKEIELLRNSLKDVRNDR
ncbi:MAG: pseudouridine synthase [Lachnospiraceae bacterium]